MPQRMLDHPHIQIDSSEALGATPLMLAAKGDHEEVVRMLLARGADVNSRDENGNTTLIEAARDDAKDAVTLLLGPRH